MGAKLRLGTPSCAKVLRGKGGQKALRDVREAFMHLLVLGLHPSDAVLLIAQEASYARAIYVAGGNRGRR